MKIQQNISLAKLTTMKIGGFAKYVLTIENREDFRDAFDFIREKNLAWFVLGDGSNVIAHGDFNGAILLNRIKGFREVSDAVFQIGAGEITDETIAKLCAKNLSGVECLSLIPGRVGALPVQNVGAYGQEISQTLTELSVFDIRDNSFKILKNSDCKFAYRDSIFKSQNNRHYIICDITLQLNREFLQPPFYPALKNYFRENNDHFAKTPARASSCAQSQDSEKISRKILDSATDKSAQNDDILASRKFSPQEIRDAVIAIRNSKLPPVREIPSAGSFFKNPIVDANFAKNFLAKNPDAPHWPLENGREKLAAGWLLDRAGLKGFAKFGFQLYPLNALVVTNVASENSAENLAKFVAEITTIVREKFGVELEQEPESL